MASKQKDLIPEGELQIRQFSGKAIRKVCHQDEWFFSVVDVVQAMSESANPRRYWTDLKSKLSKEEGFAELYDRIVQLKLPGADGKMYASDCANVETVFRIIQSIPSKNAEPFKQWLAKTGYERIQEHQNPAIAIRRAVVDYQMQGRSMEWIEARLRALVSRKELTNEWQLRGIIEGLDFAILTDEISNGTFGITTKGHKEYKSLKKNHDLRDNMTSMELILTLLGETATKQIAQSRDAQGFEQNKDAAKAGGGVAGGARKKLEQETGQKVLSPQNNLNSLPPSPDLLKLPASFEESVKKITPKK